MPTFIPNRSLLNAKFEGYKLDPVAQNDVVSRYKLNFKLTQATMPTSGSPLTMQEVQSRITHNHLVVSSQSGRAIYVDAELRVIVIDLDVVSRASFGSFPVNSIEP